MQLDHDLLSLWLEGLLLPDAARPLIEEVQTLRDRLAETGAELRDAKAEAAGAAEQIVDLQRRLDEATAFAAQLDSERTLHMRRLLGVGMESPDA